MNNIRDIQRLNEIEIEKGLVDKASWHDQFKESAYIHVGGVPFELTEGDLLAIFSQYGEIIDLDLVRDRATGKSKGFAFIGFEDQRSTVLTVDNLNGIKILDRTIKVDHTLNYQGRKPGKNEDEAEFLERERERKLAILPPHLKPRDGNDDDDEESSNDEGSHQKAKDKNESIDVNDPMSAYFARKKKEKKEKKEKKAKKASKRERSLSSERRDGSSRKRVDTEHRGSSSKREHERERSSKRDDDDYYRSSSRRGDDEYRRSSKRDDDRDERKDDYYKR